MEDLPQKFREIFAPCMMGIAVCAFVMILVVIGSHMIGGLCTSGNPFAQHVCGAAQDQRFISFIKVLWYGSFAVACLLGVRLVWAAVSGDREG